MAPEIYRFNLSAVFFDLDGTLCDSDTAWDVATRETFQLLRKQHPDVSEEALTAAWGTVHQKYFHRLNAGQCSMAEVRDSRFPSLFKELGLPQGTLPKELNDFLSACYLANLRLYEDATILEELHAYHVGLITNGAHDEHTDSQLSKVRHLGLSERIQSLTISDEVGVRKPGTQIFSVACERAGVFPEEALFVGDSIENDIRGANLAGMTSVFIHRTSEVLTPKIAHGRPAYVISNLSEVLSCLGHKGKRDSLREIKPSEKK